MCIMLWSHHEKAKPHSTTLRLFTFHMYDCHVEGSALSFVFGQDSAGLAGSMDMQPEKKGN